MLSCHNCKLRFHCQYYQSNQTSKVLDACILYEKDERNKLGVK